jgi:hypothetical protein
MGFGPVALAAIDMTMAQQKATQLLFGFSHGELGIFSGAAKITQGFIFGIGNIDSGKFTGSMKTGQIDGIAAIVFNPLAAFFGYLRWGGYHTLKTIMGKMAVNLISAGTGFVDEMQLGSVGNQLASNFI